MKRLRRLVRAALAAIAIPVAVAAFATENQRPARFHFRISFSPAIRSEPLTGRVYIAISGRNDRPPIQQVSPTGVPLFGRNVEGLMPGQSAVIDETDFGYPLQNLRDLPAGEYWV
ncbi:MAG: hypothetical protein HY654_08705, partial [Acidobacteria bacterium]|nr:hypothetical protein [Acidobacteriota bacterium]